MLDPIYDDLPDDEELMFLKLESAYREACEQNIIEVQRNEEPGYFPAEKYLQYMRQTSAAAAELQLGILQDIQIPLAEDLTISAYQDFRGQVDYYRTTLQIRHARRAQGYSVRFDAKTKRIVNHHLAQVRDIITKLEVDDWKKESLLACLNNLQAEVDRDRSRYEVFGAFIIESAGVLGSAAEKLEPIRKIIDSVAGLIWGSKHAEQTQQLPTPTERRQIPPPKTQPGKEKRLLGKQRGDMDDEIPF
jgi:hypothetical protein